MRLQRRRQTVAAQPAFEIPAPSQELRCSFLIEAEERDLIIWALHGTRFERIGFGELRYALEYPPDQISLFRVRILVNILPADRLVGPGQRTEALVNPSPPPPSPFPRRP